MAVAQNVKRFLDIPIGVANRFVDWTIRTVFRVGIFRRTCESLSRSNVLKKTSTLLLIIFVIALAARIALFAAYPGYYPRDPSDLTADSYFYDQSAVNGTRDGNFSTYWSPGFSMFLGATYELFGHNLIAPAVVLMLIGCATCIVTFFVSMRLFNNKKAAFLAALIMTIEPALVRESPAILTDTLGLFMFSIILYMFVRDAKESRLWHWAAIGGVLGYLILIRPQYEILAVAFPLYLLVSSIKKKPRSWGRAVFGIAVMLLFLGLVLAPWLAYSNAKLGQPTVSTNGGANFLMGNNENATGRTMLVSLNWTDELGANREGYDKGIDWITSNPLDALSLDIKKIVLMTLLPQRMPWEWSADPAPFWTGLIYGLAANVSYVLIEIVGFLGLAWAYKNRTPTVRTFGLILLLMYAIPVIYVVEDRYLLALMPVLTVFASAYLVARTEDILGHKA